MLLRMICADRSLEDGPGYLIAGESYQLGRSSACAFVLSDLSVSRLHAELVTGDNGVSVKDLGSRNGTFVDDVRVQQAEVKPGQRVRFGYVVFQLVGHELPRAEGPEMSELSTFIVHPKPTLRPDALDQLSKAERRVLDELLTGAGEKDVATKLGLSQHTVHNHTKAIYRKLNVNSRPELLAQFLPPEKKPENPGG